MVFLESLANPEQMAVGVTDVHFAHAPGHVGGRPRGLDALPGGG
jgi:hypothetical protein